MSRQASRIGAALTLATAFLSARPSSANPPDAFGLGSRSTALGGAVSADVSDFSANYYNPAGLARARGLELSVGYFRADHSLQTNGRDNNVDPVKGLVAGLVAPGTIAKLPFAFGLGLHLPDDRISRVRAFRQETPRWELYDNRNQRIFLAANIAISPWKWLQIGGGLSFMASTEADLDIRGSANIVSPEESALRHQVNADLTAVRYPQFGIRVAPSSRLALSAVYRGEFKLRLDLAAHLNGDISDLTTAMYDLTTHSVNNFLPQQVVIGSSWLVTDSLRTSFDLTWINWSAYVPPVATLDAKLNIPPPAGGWPQGISAPATPAPTRVAALEMHDRLVPHIGIELRALHTPKWEGFLRAGYEYAKSPMGSQSGLTNYIDRDRTSFSCGVGVRAKAPFRELRGDVRLDLHAQLSELTNEATLKKDAADLVGDYTAGGHIWNLGATMTVGF